MSTAYTHIFPGPWYKQLHNQVETLSSSLLNTVKTRCRYNMILFMCKTSQFTIYRYVHKKKKPNTIATPNAKARNNVLWQTESQ